SLHWTLGSRGRPTCSPLSISWRPFKIPQSNTCRTSLSTVQNQPNDPFRNPSSYAGEPTTLPDLPPAEPPSAGFSVQLLVIPALGVVAVIIVWVLFGKLAGGERDAMEYVRQLRAPSANWRLAFELASLIQHDPKIGSDPLLLGELTDLLSSELDRNEDPKV